MLAEPKTERDLQARIQQAQHDEKCVRFAFTFVALVGGFALAGLGYCAVLHPEFLDSTTPTLVKIFCAIGLGSLICMLVFLGCWLYYRGNSNRLYEECRQTLIETIQTRLKGQPQPVFVQTLDFSLPVPARHSKSAA